MDNAELNDAFISISPQLKAGEDPAGVLLKYARSKGLSPAQLERMCQILNTGTALCVMQKSSGAAKGRTYPLVDPVELVAKYVEIDEPMPRKKADNFWSDDSDVLSGMTEIYRRNCGVFPDTVFDTAQQAVYDGGDMSKAAAVRWKSANTAKEQNRLRIELDETRFAIRTTAEVIKNLFHEKLASCRKNDRFLLEVAQDALAHGRGEALEPLNKMAQWLDKYRVHQVMEGSDLRKVASDRHSALGWVSRLEEAWDNLKALGVYCGHIKSATEGAKDEDWDDALGPNVAVIPDDFAHATKGTDPVEHDIPKSEESDEIDADETADDTSKMSPEPAAPSRPRTGPVSGGFSESGTGGALKRPGVAGIDRESFTGGGLLGNYINDRSEAIMGNEGIRNRAVTEVGNRAILERLMLTDPVIRKADVSKTLSLYNTIAKGSPEVASDPNLLRVMLRDGLAAGHMQLHTYKELKAVEDTGPKPPAEPEKLDAKKLLSMLG